MATHPLPAESRSIDTSRYECVDGHTVERPLPNEDHARIQYAVTTLLREQAKELGCKVLQEWTLDENDQPEHNWMTPDVLVAANGQRRAPSGHLLPPAILAVEILSPDQTMAEMRLKAQRYFKWGVQHVWIIDPANIRAGTLEAAGFRLELADVFNFE